MPCGIEVSGRGSSDGRGSRPNQPALIHGETRHTYAELADRVRRLACGLSELGVQRGDRVGWLGANHPAFLETLFATAKLGAVLAPVNHHLDEAVISDVLGELSPTVVVVARSAARVPLPRGRAVSCRRRRGLRVGRRLRATDRTRRATTRVDEVVALDDLCMIAHTSGTTGMPKGVMLTHANITWNVVNLLSVAEFRSDDVTSRSRRSSVPAGRASTCCRCCSKAAPSWFPRRAIPTRSST